MAEALENSTTDPENDINELADSIKGLKVHWVDSTPECSVCLQPCLHPVQLPCTHIFCFLCVKGFAYRSKKCALCRRDVELDYFVDPIVVKIREVVSEETSDDSSIEHFQWFYEGRNGWWQYDERASSTLEESFKTVTRSCEIIIAGFTYVVDFLRMIQYRKNNPARCRRVKRDRAGADHKGVAGLQLKSVVTEICSNCQKLFHQDEIYNNRCLHCTKESPLEEQDTDTLKMKQSNKLDEDDVPTTSSELPGPSETTEI